ncbi:MAG: glycosyltransferase family 39 protein [Planctomycetota bacterium]
MSSRRSLVLLFLGCFGFFGLFAHGYLENTDTAITLQAARAWALRGDPGLVRADQVEELGAELGPKAPTWPAEHAVAHLISKADEPMYGRTGRNGRHYIWFPIGHQALLVPAVALGEQLATWWPEAEQAFVAQRGPLFGAHFWSQFCASFVSPLAAAGAVIMLLVLARSLGASPGAALLAVASAVFCTQFWPGSRETMSNMPGTFFFCATVAMIGRYAAGAGPSALLWAGAFAGPAVLVRYPLALPMAPFALWAVVTATRRGRLWDLAWLVGGGLPWLGALLAANYLRFGDITATGYLANSNLGSLPLWQGLIALLLAPGKGVLWFSPPLVLALLALRRRSRWSLPALGALAAFALPVLLYANVGYWASGQCWGIRYLTSAAVVLCVVVFATAQPWRRRPRIFGAVCAIGLVFSIGGVITPYVGHQHLALQAGRVIYGPLPNVDNNVNFDPRLSPLHSHWTYAWLAAQGRIASADPTDTLTPLFGIEAEAPVQPLPHATQSAFRHVWLRSLPLVLPGFPAGVVAALWVGLTGLALGLGVRAFWLPRSPPLAG